MSESTRHYPMLTPCRVVLSNPIASNNSINSNHNRRLQHAVRLPEECIYAASSLKLPEPYDFALEKSILQTKEMRDRDQMLSKADSRDELQRAVLVKMQSVTNASEDICIALLQSNSYDLKTSIEAFYQER